MSIKAEETIWFPGNYVGRSDGEYTKLIADVSMAELTELVQRRAQEDGEWTLANDLVGSNEVNMRKMMKFVSNPVNIEQCVGHILKAGAEADHTVDWVCQDLARASKYVHGSSG